MKQPGNYMYKLNNMQQNLDYPDTLVTEAGQITEYAGQTG